MTLLSNARPPFTRRGLSSVRLDACAWVDIRGASLSRNATYRLLQLICNDARAHLVSNRSSWGSRYGDSCESLSNSKLLKIEPKKAPQCLLRRRSDLTRNRPTSHAAIPLRLASICICSHRENDIDLRRCRGTTCGSTIRGARKRGAPPSSFCIVEHSRVASHVQEGIEAGETASPLTNWPSLRRAPHPAKEAAASKSRSAFYRFEIRSREGGLSPPAISCDESREPSC